MCAQTIPLTPVAPAQIPKKRVWCGTWNSPPDMEPAAAFSNVPGDWVVQVECGKESGLIHWQFCVQFKNARHFNSVAQMFPGAHLETARGNWKQNVAYCTKADTRVSGPFASNESLLPKLDFPWKPKKDIMEWKSWHLELRDILMTQPDPRKILVYIDTQGGAGKTAFAMHMMDTYNGVLCVNGNIRDIMNMISNRRKDDATWEPNVIFIDAGREQGNNISWRAVEEIKNGRIINTKYEASTITFGKPHVVVFMNCEPEMGKLSEDRWEIRYLSNIPIEIDVEKMVQFEAAHIRLT